MATPKSPQVVQQLIDSAMENEQSLIQWIGSGGLESVLSAINQNIIYRGIMPFPSIESMALSGGGDSQYAVCPKDSIIGLNFYKYFPNIDSTIVGGVTSSQGGQWRPVYASQNALAGVWVANTSPKDIVPDTDYVDFGVGIGKNTCADNLWLDIENLDDAGKGRAVKFPTLSIAEMNDMLGYVNNSLIVNSQDKMLLRYDSGEGNFKSAGVFSGNVLSSAGSGTVGIIITFSAIQHANDYKVYVTPTNSPTAAILAGGYYISDKTTTSFKINFLVPVVTTNPFSIDYQISH